MKIYFKVLNVAHLPTLEFENQLEKKMLCRNTFPCGMTGHLFLSVLYHESRNVNKSRIKHNQLRVRALHDMTDISMHMK